MKYFTLLALISQSNAVPIVGGITKEIACKDMVDITAGTTTSLIADCTYDAADPYKCSIIEPIGGGGTGEYSATDWSDAADKCAAAFDTDGGDRKCAQAGYDGDGGGTCYAFTTSA